MPRYFMAQDLRRATRKAILDQYYLFEPVLLEITQEARVHAEQGERSYSVSKIRLWNVINALKSSQLLEKFIDCLELMGFEVSNDTIEIILRW